MIVVSVFQLRFQLIKTKVCLPRVYVILDDFVYPFFMPFGFAYYKIYVYLALQFACLLAHMMKVIFRSL